MKFIGGSPGCPIILNSVCKDGRGPPFRCRNGGGQGTVIAQAGVTVRFSRRGGTVSVRAPNGGAVIVDSSNGSVAVTSRGGGRILLSTGKVTLASTGSVALGTGKGVAVGTAGVMSVGTANSIAIGKSGIGVRTGVNTGIGNGTDTRVSTSKRAVIGNTVMVVGWQGRIVVPGTTEVASVRAYPVRAPNMPPIPRIKKPVTNPKIPAMLVKGVPTTIVNSVYAYMKPPSAVIGNSTAIVVNKGPTTHVNSAATRNNGVMVKYPAMVVKK